MSNNIETPCVPGRHARRWSAGEIAAWVIIIGTIVAMLALRAYFAPAARVAKVKASAEQPELQMVIAGRYTVGAAHLLSEAEKAGVKPAREKPLGEALDHLAKSDSDKLRVAIVAGELHGKAAALQRLDQLRDTPGVRKDVALLRGIYQGNNATRPAGEEWESFQHRNGWFADLAASYGKPETDPLRKSVIEAAERTAAMTMLMFGLILLALVSGVVLLIVAIVLWSTGRLRPRFGIARPLPPRRSPYVEGFALYLAAIAWLGAILHYVFHLGTLWSILTLPAGFAAAVIWPLLRGQSWQDWRMAVGLHTGRGVFREIAAGALGYVAGIPIFAAGFVVTFILIKLTGADASHPISQEIQADPLRIIELLLLASVYAPITEELMFRGQLFTHLRERWGFWAAALAVSLVFAIIHPQGLVALPVLGSLALVLATIREWRGSIIGCMTAHAINNTIVLVSVVLMIS